MDNSPGSVASYVKSLIECARFAPQIACHKILPAVDAEFGTNHLRWSRAITQLLEHRGINLYTHQTLATDHIRAGHSIVAATPTASGKSLIYNLPVLEQFLHDPDATSLYLFPLKALAQDQLGSFNSLCESWPKEARPRAAIYDGDTSNYRRKKIRSEPPTVLITNPEMLHLAILPFHQNWSTFLANLSYVVVDEAHIYRGVFGSHMSLVFRRLNRIAANYGADPVYIFCTATLGNPDELGMKLMGKAYKPALVDKSGAPQGKRHFLFVNPEQAASTCAIDLLKRALEQGLRTIVYCQTRRLTELISIWAGSESGPWVNRISSYRSGYLPEERREIEARMASGELLAVVSTSALELGIDIGGLDVCILVGYPGTVTQTLQRGGRVGRGGQESAVILVAGEDALDQYFVRHPQEFFTRAPELATVNPDNRAILMRHLECAAAELPLNAGEAWLRPKAVMESLKALEQAGLAARTAETGQWIARRRRPQRDVDLRGSGNSYVLEDRQGNVIGMMDAFRAWKEAHPGAVYLHRGKSYIVGDVDSGSMRICLDSAKVGWFTRPRSKKDTAILEEYDRKAVGRCAVFKGRLCITEQITGYERRSSIGSRLINITPLDAPLQVYETEGFWFVIPDAIRLSMEQKFLHFMGSIHALEHALIGLLPLQVMSDRNDFGGISIPLHYQLGLPAVFVYDGFPGGAGLCTSAYEEAGNILDSTLQAIADCPCEDGCPSCIQSPKCGAGNRPLSKEGVISLLNEIKMPGIEGQNIVDELKITPAHSFDHIDIPNLPLVNVQRDCASPVQPENRTAESAPPVGYVVFDVETRKSAREVGGWNSASKMGVSVAVLFDSRTETFESYGQDELPLMFDKMASASLIVGFNSLRFDYKVLEPFAEIYPGKSFDLRKLPSLDLLQKIHAKLNYRVSLDNLCRATLGSAKTSDGLQALAWWKEGRIEEIAAYCKMDVELTRDLYLFGLREKYLFYTNKAGSKVRVDIDFVSHSQNSF